MESDNEWLDSPQVYSFTISKFPAAADYPIEIQGFKTKSLFDTGPKYLVYPVIAIGNLYQQQE